MSIPRNLLKLLRFLKHSVSPKGKSFKGATRYWIDRYAEGGDSAAPKYPLSCKFKADTLNAFAGERNVQSVIDFGCGEGIQAELFNFVKYTGVDVSPQAIDMCIQRMGNSQSRSFITAESFADVIADMTLSLDVLYHLVEDPVFNEYMNTLFGCAGKYVAIFAPDEEDRRKLSVAHVKHRKYGEWVRENKPDWSVILDIPNPHHNHEGKSGDAPVSRLRIYERKQKQ